MGVQGFFAKFLIAIAKKKYLVPISTSDHTQPIAMIIDLNSILYPVADEIYCTGDKLNGTKFEKISETIKKIVSNKTEEELRLLFRLKLKEILTKNILEKFRPSDILIIAMDGIAFRAKQKQQASRRFSSKGDNLKFNGSQNFTYGTKMMELCYETVHEWLEENSSSLPTIRYFSDHNEDGEGEHKMFRLLDKAFEKLKNKLEEQFEGSNFSKRFDKKVKEGKILVVGKDSDLFFLSLMRSKYNILWYRDMANVYKTNLPEGYDDSVSISVLRNFICNRMSGISSLTSPFSGDIKRYVRDFILMSFLIGDDFVPGSTCLTLHSGLSLDKMMEIYSELGYELTSEIEDDLRIDMTFFKIFLERVSILEKSMYNEKIRVQRLEKSGEETEELKNLRTHLDANPKYTAYFPSDLLDGDDFEDFETNWSKKVVCPNYFSLSKKEKKIINSLESIEDEFKDACKSYLTGLQWNLSYYFGYVKLGDWVYMWSYAPLITSIVKDMKTQTITKHIDNEISTKTAVQTLFTIFNIYISEKFLRGFCGGKKSQKIDTPKLLNVPLLFEAYHPIEFKRELEGCYARVERDKRGRINQNKLYGHTVLLPFPHKNLQDAIKNDKIDLKAARGIERKKYGKSGRFTSGFVSNSQILKRIEDKVTTFGEVTEIKTEEIEEKVNSKNFPKKQNINPRNRNKRGSSFPRSNSSQRITDDSDDDN